MDMISEALLLRSVRVPADEGTATDVRIRDGRIEAIGPGLSAADASVEECGGALLMPALIDAHCHVDKTVWGTGRWLSHTAGPTVSDRMQYNAEVRDQWGIPSVEYTSNLLAAIVGNGTSHIRTHTDVDPGVGLRGVEVVAECAERFAGLLDIQQVAFPQLGLISKPGTSALIDEATGMGVSVIGGIDPAGRDRDPVGSLNEIFALATRTHCGVDVHLHDPGELGAWQFELICERTAVESMQGRVTISHGFALGEVSAERQAALIELMATSGVSMATAMPFKSPLLPLAALREGGVPVALANDSIRNTWSPFGTGDMLDRAMLIGHRLEYRKDEDLRSLVDMASVGGAAVLGLPEPAGTVVGAPADLVTVDALNVCEAVVAVPTRRLVIHGGRVVARDGSLSVGSLPQGGQA